MNANAQTDSWALTIGRWYIVASLVTACGSNVETLGAGENGGNNASSSGAPSGGTAAGGAGGPPYGGASTGGDGASEPVAGGSAGDPPSADIECQEASDCTLVNNCCECNVLASGESAKECDPGIACDDSFCSANGFGEIQARCFAGKCSLGMDCNQVHAACDVFPPQCTGGTIPSVVGSCWGPCVEPKDCLDIGDCDGCNPETSACVINHVLQQSVQCVKTWEACDGLPTCECMGDQLCFYLGGYCQEQIGMPHPGFTCIWLE